MPFFIRTASGCPNALQPFCFPLGPGDNEEDGWGAVAVHGGQKHARFVMERLGVDLGSKVWLAGDAELCCA